VTEDASPIEVGSILIDPAAYEVAVRGEPVRLTLMQFNILRALARRPGWVQSPEALAASLPPNHRPFTQASLRNQVYHLRRRLGEAGTQLETVRGLGYRLRRDGMADDGATDGTPNSRS
jgi:DNA-binding response OmpR family regulator